MISNYVVKEKVLALKKKKSALILEEQELIKGIQATGVSKQASWKQRRGYTSKIENELIDLRETYAKRVTEIKKEIISINSELDSLYRIEDSDKNNALLDVFKDIFTNGQMVEIKKEAERRMKGEDGFKLSFSVKDCIDVKEELSRTKKQVLEYANKLVSTRAILTGIVQEGCKELDEAKFLKVIAPLNRNVLPLDYITEIKKRHLIK